MGEQFDSREFLESAADYFWQPVRNYTSIRKQKLSKHTPPKDKSEKDAHLYQKEWTGRGTWRQLPEGCEFLSMGLLTHTSRIPISRGRLFRTVPARQCWETNKTRLKNYRQQNDKEEQHDGNGLEFSVENRLTLLEHGPDEVGMSDLRRAHPARPAALGHLSLSSFAVATPATSFCFHSRRCPNAAWKGYAGKDFFI